MSRRPTRIAALAATLLLAACGLSTNEEPETIGGPTIASNAGSDESVIELPTANTETVPVWFLHNRTDEVGVFVIRVERQVVRPASPGVVLDALLQQPPDETEREDGIWSAIPLDASLVAEPELQGTMLTVQLSDRVYSELHGLLAQYAFAQIVYTATAIDGIDSVLFLEDDGVFPAVDGAGQAHTDPLRPSDYAELEPVIGA